jgi:hypothetical protein
MLVLPIWKHPNGEVLEDLPILSETEDEAKCDETRYLYCRPPGKRKKILVASMASANTTTNN